MSRQLWTGLVEVGVLPGSSALGGAVGAYVNAVALVSNQVEFEGVVVLALKEIGLFAIGFEGVSYSFHTYPAADA